MLSGEPGIGKTRLCEEAAVSAESQGAHVLWGRCHEIEGRPPFWPWVQLLQALARDGAPAELAGSLDADSQPLGLLVPELRPHLRADVPAAPSLDSETARFRLFQSMTALLRRTASRRPRVVMLDDLHWADLPSLRLLEFLAHELADAPIAVFGTYREVEVRLNTALGEVLGRLGRYGTTLPLAGLTVDEVSTFVTAACGRMVPRELAGRLHQETEGNPFFLDEIVRLSREGRTDLFAGPTGTRLSHGVRGAIQQRLAPLPPETRRLVSIAAIAGRDFDLPLLGDVLEASPATLIQQLEPALGIELVVAVPGRVSSFRFAHALVRETLRESVAAHERAALHQQFGQSLERRHGAAIEGVVAELAHHYFEASANGVLPQAIDYAERAGRQALQLLAYEEAAEQFGRALHLAELAHGAEPMRVCELLLGLGDAKNRAGLTDESVQAYHRAAAVARQLGASALLARAGLGLCGVGTGWTEFGRSDDKIVSLLQEALDQLSSDDLDLRARVLSRLATELYWATPPVDTNALSSEAVALARRSGDAATLGYALLGRLHCLADPSFVGERERLIDELMVVSGGRGELAQNGYLWRLGNLQQLDRMAEVEACGDSLIQAVTASRQPGDQWLIDAVRAQRALVAGRLAEAESAVEPILNQPSHKANAEQAAVSLLFLVRREQGRQAELAEGLRAFAYQDIDAAVWRAALAMLYCESGALTEAKAELDGITRDGLLSLRRDNGWALAMACLAVTCRSCGTPDQAKLLYDSLVPYDGENVVGGPFYFMGPVSYYLGLLAHVAGDHERARRHLAASLHSARRNRAWPSIARILLAEADSHALDGAEGASTARRLRREAATIADRLGMGGVAQLARAAGDIEAGGGTVAATRATLNNDGAAWTLLYDGRRSQLRPLKGFRYLTVLLMAPGQERHALEVMARASDDGAVVAPQGVGLGPALDSRAKEELRLRVEELRAELADAEETGEPLRAERARDEIEAIGGVLASALGLGGRDRPTGKTSERARAAVTKAIRAAIAEVAKREPGLADMLTRTVRTGTFCSYEPLLDAPIEWDV